MMPCLDDLSFWWFTEGAVDFFLGSPWFASIASLLHLKIALRVNDGRKSFTTRPLTFLKKKGWRILPHINSNILTTHTSKIEFSEENKHKTASLIWRNYSSYKKCSFVKICSKDSPPFSNAISSPVSAGGGEVPSAKKRPLPKTSVVATSILLQQGVKREVLCRFPVYNL